MIENDVIEAFNNRLTIDPNSIKKMTPSQLDRVKVLGSQAENLLKNKDFAYFVHTYKFECLDLLAEVGTHTQDDNAQRIAISNQIAGLDGFIKSLKRAVYYRNRVVTSQNKDSGEPIA
jgi:hypothetical protein